MSSSIASRVPPASPPASAGEKRNHDEMEADEMEADAWTLEAAAARHPDIPWDGKDWTGLDPVNDGRDPIAWCSHLIWVAVSFRRSMLSAKQRAAQRTAERSSRGPDVAAPGPRNDLQSIARDVMAVVEDRRPSQSPQVPQADIPGPAVPAGLATSGTELVDLLKIVLASQQAAGQLESTESEAESKAESEAPPHKKQKPLSSAPQPAPAPVPDPKESGQPTFTPTITPPQNKGDLPIADPTWQSMPIPEAPAMPAQLGDKTVAAYQKAIVIHGPGVKRHVAGPCMTCARGGQARCVVNDKVNGGNICAPCAKKKEQCWYTLLADAEVVKNTGVIVDRPCGECFEECARRWAAGDDEYEHLCVVLKKDCKGKVTATATACSACTRLGKEDSCIQVSACSACMKLGKKESCTLNSKPKKERNGKPRDLAK